MILSGEAVRSAEKRLALAGIENARLDAVLLVAAAMESAADTIRLRPTLPLTPAAEGRLMALLDRRAEKREPVSRILGQREFWSLPFALGPATLDPRPDTEAIVSTVLDHIDERSTSLRFLDLGTGTGCILLAILSELPFATGIGLDISPDAVDVAEKNATTLGFADRARFNVADWNFADWQSALVGNSGQASTKTPTLDVQFDWILSNPPYIESDQIAGLSPEVAAHDPHTALDGGQDGLDAYRAIIPQMPPLLRPGGGVIFELGEGQAPALSALLHETSPTSVSISNDLAGRTRCIVAKY